DGSDSQVLDDSETYSHTYPDSGDYSGVVYAGAGYDGDGNMITLTAPFTANVVNTAPFATLVSSFDDATNTLSASLINAWDPSSPDTDAGFHYSVSTDFDALASNYADANAAPTIQLSSGQVGEHDGWIRIFDQDGGFRDYNATLTIPDLAVTQYS